MSLWQLSIGLGYGNEDLIAGIKVNTDAMARTTQLAQQGYVKMTEE
jgi:hypothetical protein